MRKKPISETMDLANSRKYKTESKRRRKREKTR
jgi:hypothetical protein